MNKTKTTSKEPVVLAIYPHKRALGYAVMNSPTSMITCKHRYVNLRNATSGTSFIATLVDLYEPDLIVLESKASREQYRGERLLKFFSNLEKHIVTLARPIHHVSRKEIRMTLSVSDKNEMNDALIERFPRLAEHKPRQRAVCDSGEPESQCAFDALSLALTFYLMHHPTAS